MKKRILVVLLCACTLLCCLPLTAGSAMGVCPPGNEVAPASLVPVEEGETPDMLEGDQPNTLWYNRGSDRYHVDPITSYLYANQDGGLTRVKCFDSTASYIDDVVVVEEYDSGYNLQSRLYPEMELPIWGGFFAGEKYNFLIFGRGSKEGEDTEVLRVVSYDKEWNRLGHASLYGANTSLPFNGGTLRCTEVNGFLFIHTCHQMWMTDDGFRHQSNMTVSIDQDAMEVAYARYEVGGLDYVSHSFNQFILTNQEGGLAILNHGDGYPRALVVNEYAAEGAAQGELQGGYRSTFLQSFPGGIGNNYTGASVGGFVETENGYLASYSYVGDNPEEGQDGRDVYLCFIDKETFSGEPTQITYTKDAAMPILAPTGLDGGYIMWNGWQDNACTDTLYYARYDANGQVGEIQQATGRLSDCAPVLYNGKLVWYTTSWERYGGPMSMVFYSLDASGNVAVEKAYVPQAEPTPTPTPTPPPTSRFIDVPANSWYAKAVEYVVENGIMVGTSRITFEPTTQTTRAMVARMLYQMEGKPSSGRAPFVDVEPGQWYAEAVYWAAENGIVSGTGGGRFAPNQTVTREQLAMMLYKYAGFKGMDVAGGADLRQFSDAGSVSSWAERAVQWAVSERLINGKTNGGVTKLDPQGLASRAEVAQVFMKFCESNGGV